MKKQLITIAIFVALTLAARADVYPSRTITLVVPFAAGGPTDTLARILAERMGRELGQTIVVEDVSGASGSLGVGRVVRAAPDGYTLSIGHLGTHVLNGAIYNLNYDLERDLAPISLLANNPQLIVVNKTMPAKSLEGLIAWLKDNPNKATVGTAGGRGALPRQRCVLCQ